MELSESSQQEGAHPEIELARQYINVHYYTQITIALLMQFHLNMIPK
jgi:hypothetical protein